MDLQQQDRHKTPAQKKYNKNNEKTQQQETKNNTIQKA